MIFKALDLSQLRFMNINNCNANLLMNIRLSENRGKKKNDVHMLSHNYCTMHGTWYTVFYTNHYHGKTFCICKKFNPKHALNMKSTFSDLILHTVFPNCNPCVFLDYRASLFVISYV